MDPDHLDIYGTPEQVEEAFIIFTDKIRKGGTLLYKYGLKRADELKGDQRLSYHAEDHRADVHVSNLRTINGGYLYDVVIQQHIIKDISLRVGGLHNVENSLPAITLAHLLKIEDDKIREVFHGFNGVKRRFEYWLTPGEGAWVMIDDYAHHPEELRALLKSTRSLFKGYGLLIIFQPHLYSRTRDLAGEFAESLDLADSVILLPVYPARELPVDGVSSKMIMDSMKSKDKILMEKEELFASLNRFLSDRRNVHDKWVIITAGAGDIDAMLPRLKEILKNEQ
jgi:UDP-N-acetylmuramate--alanine ligase